MKNLLQKIRSKISNVSNFSEEIKMRKATLYDFLNNKIDVRLSTFMDIITPLGFAVIEELPDNFIEVEAVYKDGETYKKGGMYKGKKIEMCFGCPGSSHQLMLIEQKDFSFKLEVC